MLSAKTAAAITRISRAISGYFDKKQRYHKAGRNIFRKALHGNHEATFVDIPIDSIELLRGKGYLCEETFWSDGSARTFLGPNGDIIGVYNISWAEKHD